MELQIIKQQDVLGKEFRIYGDFENPLFLAKDVAEWIDYSKTSQGYFDVSNMLKSVDEDEKVKEFTTTNNLRSGCEQWFLIENGLYEVLMLSRKPIAKQFKKEVKKILHEIRTKGSFGVPRSFAEALQLAADQQKRIEEQQLAIEQSKPKVEFFDKVTGSSDTCDMKEVAKILNFKGVGRNKLFEILRAEKILDRQNQPYQQYVDSGYFRVIESKWEDKDGDIHINLKTVVFQSGVDFIRKVLMKQSKIL